MVIFKGGDFKMTIFVHLYQKKKKKKKAQNLKREFP